MCATSCLLSRFGASSQLVCCGWQPIMSTMKDPSDIHSVNATLKQAVVCLLLGHFQQLLRRTRPQSGLRWHKYSHLRRETAYRAAVVSFPGSGGRSWLDVFDFTCKCQAALAGGPPLFYSHCPPFFRYTFPVLHAHLSSPLILQRPRPLSTIFAPSRRLEPVHILPTVRTENTQRPARH